MSKLVKTVKRAVKSVAKAVSPRRQYQKHKNLLQGEGFRTDASVRGNEAADVREDERAKFLEQFGDAQMPDEDSLRSAARRRAARRRGSRASTVLTNRDTLG